MALPNQVFDLAILGGGINGAGIAAQAAQAGLSVILLEKDDFASGTSSKSTKLIHGGIRYLEQFRFPLVFEALHERKRLMDLAPHLVHSMPFLLPCYEKDGLPPWKLRAGLWLYDLLAGSTKWASHQWFTPAEALQEAPDLDPKGLKGCGLYFDAQVNDARLVLENILQAEKAGAQCLSRHQVERITENTHGILLEVRNLEAGATFEVRTSHLVNASGPWANQTQKMIVPNARNLVRPTRGTHIVVPQVLTDRAVLIKSQQDDRVLFVIPWRGYSLVGTTDLDDPHDPDHVQPTEEEIQYLLTEAGRVFPGRSWKKDSVLSAFAGLRPLAHSGDGQASSVSREDRILKTGRVITVVGGKLTTYYAMAGKVLSEVLGSLGKKKKPAPEKLPGSPQEPWDLFLQKAIRDWPKEFGIDGAQARHLASLYGKRAEEVLLLVQKEPTLLGRLAPERPEIAAQVIFAVRNEKARHLEDVMLRRTELGYGPYRWGTASRKASDLMARELGWNEVTKKNELEDYRKKLFPAPKL
ncbi:MAG TPA: glycerol-3-phosphate dehydrogenase [bacterium]|nr:glycerol-3-phosphate dehydrogenase [bacterium]